ncbi:hypothetical protein TW1_043 [Pseudoalteromonas phage TW1]|uniref:hypothetical protein n=1 Tax=Pseudoalteromonas phage TW1 TaxID=1366055 RepID=UPI00035AB2E1|nr:hypothetical protein PP585_gp43 [Pseudoalteromonas phage TW1]AGR46559.1 hypothetical protein TW1_043 [Pseudoalteromonas phage TW1]
MADKPKRLRVADVKINMLCSRNDYLNHMRVDSCTIINFKSGKYCKVDNFGRVRWYDTKTM